ncbi:MAG: thioredoxin family protein [Pedobacter sp.]
MNAICSNKSMAFLKGNASIPTRSGCFLEKLSLCLAARRKGRWGCFLPVCIALVACFWLGCPAGLCAADKLNSFDYATALQKGKETQRPLFIFFTTPWCYQCTEMKRKVFQNKEIISILNERFLLVEVDISQEKKLKEDFRIYYTPTSLFLDIHGKPIIDVKGYIPTNRFRELLRFVSEGYYKTTVFSDFEKK